MKWKAPVTPLMFLFGVAAFTTVQFFARWAGQGNMPGPDPRGWGDPIPFDRAVQQLPAMFAASLIGGIFLTAVYGFQLNRSNARRVRSRFASPARAMRIELSPSSSASSQPS